TIKARQGLRIVCQLLGEHFHGYQPFELCVFGSIDLSHAAHAEWRNDLIGPEAAAWNESHVVGCDYNQCDSQTDILILHDRHAIPGARDRFGAANCVRLKELKVSNRNAWFVPQGLTAGAMRIES